MERVILNSKFLKNMVIDHLAELNEHSDKSSSESSIESQIEEYLRTNEEYTNELIKTLPFPIDNVIKLEEGYYGFNEKELLTLINNLDYLDHVLLDDVLNFVKFIKIPYIEINLNKNFKRKYKNTYFDYLHQLVKLKNFNAIKWLYNLYPTKVNKQRVFEDSCHLACLEIAQWVYTLNSDNHGEGLILSNGTLYNACRCENLNMIMWLYSLNIFDITYEDNIIFRTVCERGFLKIAKWIYSLGKFNLDSNMIEKTFSQTCGNGKLELAKWYYSVLESYCNRQYAFSQCCMWDNFETGQWLVSLNKNNDPKNIDLTNGNYFVYACRYNSIKIAKWLYTFGVDNFSIREGFDYAGHHGYYKIVDWIISLKCIDLVGYNNFNGSTNLQKTMQKEFVWVCYRGFLNVAKSLYSLGNNIITEEIVVSAFKRGDLKFIIWLKSLDVITINKMIQINEYGQQPVIIDANLLFTFTCSSGGIKLAKWMYDLGIVDFSKIDFVLTSASGSRCVKLVKFILKYNNPTQNDIQKAFEKCCETNDLPIAKFLYKNFKNEITYANPFKIACLSSYNFEFVKWVYSLSNDNIHEINLNLFLGVLNPKKYFWLVNLDVLKWLYSFGNIDINFNEGQLFREACEKHKLNLAKCLYSFGCFDINVQNVYNLKDLI